MASIATIHHDSYLCYFKINEEKHFLSEKDIGEQFVRTQSYKNDWSYAAEEPSEKNIRSKALKLIAYNSDGSMHFSSKCYQPRLSSEWNDGNWISVEKCIKLFQDNSPKIERVYIPTETSLCPVRIRSRL